jgi:hypothetical protein
MSRLLPVLIVVAIVAFVFFVMLLAWRKRALRSTGLDVLDALPTDAEFIFDISNVFYVATVRSQAPLERIALRGLRYRGHADIRLFDTALEIQVRGEHPVVIQADRLIGVEVSQVVVDKVVEPDGLMSIEWQSGSEQLSTVFRVQQPVQRTQFLRMGEHISAHIIQQRPQSNQAPLKESSDHA